MARGPKRHLKRLAAPRHWMLSKMGGKYASRPSTGRHKLRECMPLTVILRNRLKYALSRDEVMRICMQKLIEVDGKIRTDTRFPCGFMDVINIPKSGDTFRMLYNTKRRFVLHRIDSEEAKFKLCRVTRQEMTKKGIPTITVHDGRTIRYPDPHARVLDTVKIDIATGKVTEVLKFELGSLVMITRGRNTGRVGVLMHRDRHPGSFDIVHVRDKKGRTFATRLDNAFIIGKGEEPSVELPHGEGVKKFLLD